MTDPLTSGLIAFISLVSAAFTKIMLMLLTVLAVFLFIPQSRLASMLGVSIASSFVGGILIHLYSIQASWTLAATVSVSFTAGLFVFPFLMIFSKFYKMLSEDNELHEDIYNGIKALIIKKFSRFISLDKYKKK